jgi:hypothetical protein
MKLSDLYCFHIKEVLIYDPTLRPVNLKCTEEEQQDAKLIYYYPENTSIHEKRNHVGLAEGFYQFWTTLVNVDENEVSTESRVQAYRAKRNKNSVLYLDNYIHTQQEVEENVWIYMVLLRNNTETEDSRIRNCKSLYYSPESNAFQANENHSEVILLFLQYFY